MNHPFLSALLGEDGEDPGCERAFDLLDAYVEAVHAGRAAAVQFPGVVLHLRNCVGCAEDAEGLLVALDLP